MAVFIVLHCRFKPDVIPGTPADCICHFTRFATTTVMILQRVLVISKLLQRLNRIVPRINTLLPICYREQPLAQNREQP